MEKRLRSPKMVFIRYPLAISCYSIFQKIRNYTMVPYDALYQMKNLIQKVDRNGIKGAIVETGCWNGGCGAFMAHVSKKNGSNRQTWIFDSFEGLPKPSEDDRAIAEKVHRTMNDLANYLATPIENAQTIAKKLHVEDIMHIVKGWFNQTVPENKDRIGAIAILRLDGDYYESTKVVLDHLYPSVTPGGYIVIDDFDYPGCRKAIYDYFYENKISPVIKEGGKYQKFYFQKD